MPVLVPTEREDAPLRMLRNNTLVRNTFPSEKSKYYELCIVSNRELNQDVRYALSTLMRIVGVNEETDRNYMAIECFTIPHAMLPMIDQKFIDKFISSHNSNKTIEEVAIEYSIDERVVKIKNIKYHVGGWVYKNTNLHIRP